MGIRSTCAHSTGLYPSLMQQDFVLSCRICAAMVLHVSYPLTPCTGYQIQDIANSNKPIDPEQERRFWYQFYFNTKWGRKGLTQMRARGPDGSRYCRQP